MPPHCEETPLADDGLVPNNPRLALRLYRGGLAADLAGGTAAIVARFAGNGWTGAWVDGIYPFHHYHARSHEVLGLAAGRARVQFGGPSGPVVAVGAGDAVLIPAGVGHCLVEGAAGLVVVGAYPAGQEDPDLRRATAADRAAALLEIPRVPLPPVDPVLGGGPPWPIG